MPGIILFNVSCRLVALFNDTLNSSKGYVKGFKFLHCFYLFMYSFKVAVQ